MGLSLPSWSGIIIAYTCNMYIFIFVHILLVKITSLLFKQIELQHLQYYCITSVATTGKYALRRLLPRQ